MGYPIIDLANIRETLEEKDRKKFARYARRQARLQRRKKVVDNLYNV